jgi:hypothetical protein
VRDGKLDPALFSAASLDEASVLRGFGGTKTFREFMRLFEFVPYRFVATATPSPNEYIELLAYAAFLGIMDVGQAKTRFFKRNSEEADNLTLHPHKTEEFWLWVASWALFIQKPSDLGFSDEGYDLPEVEVRWHEVPSDHKTAGAERDGQQRMFKDAALGIVDASREKRDSLPARLASSWSCGPKIPMPIASCGMTWRRSARRSRRPSLPWPASMAARTWTSANRPSSSFRMANCPSWRPSPSSPAAGAISSAIAPGRSSWASASSSTISGRPGTGSYAMARPEEVPHRSDLYRGRAQVKATLQEKWKRHEEQAAIMQEIVRKYGLSHLAMAGTLARTMGVSRQEVAGEHFTCINNDCVIETARMAENSAHMIVTSIPFATQYEYTPSYNDFGHTDDDAHFWRRWTSWIPTCCAS